MKGENARHAYYSFSYDTLDHELLLYTGGIHMIFMSNRDFRPRSNPLQCLLPVWDY